MSLLRFSILVVLIIQAQAYLEQNSDQFLVHQESVHQVKNSKVEQDFGSDDSSTKWKQTITSLIQNGDKINWDVLSDSLQQIGDTYSSARKEEDQSYEEQLAVQNKLLSVHQHEADKLKVEIARSQESITKTLEPYAEELSEALKEKSKLFESIDESLKNTEYERTTYLKSYKSEMDEMTSAQSILDEMIEVLQKARAQSQISLLEVKSQIKPLHTRFTEIINRHNTEPISEIISSLAEIMSQDFKQSQILKQLVDLLEKCRTYTLETRISLIGQNEQNNKSYEKRKQALLDDQESNKGVYSSKLEQYNTVTKQISDLKDYIKWVQTEYDSASAEVQYLTSLNQNEQQTQITLQKELTLKQQNIVDAVKLMGKGIEFEGESLQ